MTPPNKLLRHHCLKTLKQAKRRVYAPDTVIADAVFVLASPRLYHVDRSTVTTLLTPLVRLPHLCVRNRPVVLRALVMYSSMGLDFGDAMIIAAMEQAGAHHLYSCDSDFDRVPGITRLTLEEASAV